jgi:hypothetical protein
MPDENQIEIPQTFIALFVERGRLQANATQQIVIARYELCEDMACTLVEHAQTMQFDQGLSEAEVLVRCHAALLAEASVITAKEAAWVIFRLAELLSWPPPPPADTGHAA